MLKTPFAPRNFPSGDESQAIEVIGHAAPLEVAGFEREYQAVRHSVGLYDFSMLHKFDFLGPGALDAVNAMVVRDLGRVRPGRIAYGPVVDDVGLMYDDSTCMVLSAEHVRVTGGALLPQAIAESPTPGSVTIEPLRDRLFQLNVQGPGSRALLSRLTDENLSNEAFSYYTFRQHVAVAGIDCFIARMGFSGELGYELWGPVERALDMWDRLTEAAGDTDVVGVGGICVITVRTEAGMIMGDDLDYGRDTSPWECTLGWTVSETKRGYRGCEAVLAARSVAPRRLVTVVLDAEASSDATMSPLFVHGKAVGRLNFAVTSPLTGTTVAMSSVEAAWATPGTSVTVVVDGIEMAGSIVATPLHDPERRRVRS